MLFKTYICVLKLQLPECFQALAAILIAVLCTSSSIAAPVRLDQCRIGEQSHLPIYEWRDKSRANKGIIVAVHGMTLYAACFEDYAKHLAAQGFHVFALDQRGFGRWQSESSKFNGNGKIEIGQSQQDLLDLVTTLKQTYAKQKIFLLGESLGSNMALSLVSEHPELADGAILAALCYKRRLHPKPKYWVTDFAKEVIKPNSPLNLTPFSAPYLTNDAKVAKSCNRDPLINRKMTPEDLIKIDLLNDKAIAQAKKLPANFPLLLVSGAQDAMFKAVDLPNLVPKLGSKKVVLHLIEGKGHLLLEHQKVDPKVGSIIDTWLQKQLKVTKAIEKPAATE